MKKIIIIFLGVLGFLIVVNLGILDWVVFRSESGKWEVGGWKLERIIGSEKLNEEEFTTKDTIATGSCELACQDLIEEKIKEELSKLPSLAGQSSVSPTVVIKTKTPTSVNGKPKIVYMPLVAGGSMGTVDWADIVPSEFYFNLSDYPNVKEVRFEAYLSSVNGDQVFARLYDATNNRGVDYSDLLTANTAFTRIESSSMKIWAGNNKYTVQLRSVNGTSVLLKDAKLKIIY